MPQGTIKGPVFPHSERSTFSIQSLWKSWGCFPGNMGHRGFFHSTSAEVSEPSPSLCAVSRLGQKPLLMLSGHLLRSVPCPVGSLSLTFTPDVLWASVTTDCHGDCPGSLKCNSQQLLSTGQATSSRFSSPNFRCGLCP